MERKSRSWLVIGSHENWDTSLVQPIPIWGLKPIHSRKFQDLQPGEIIWIYVKSPIKGVIGVAETKDKYIDTVNLLWDEERRQKKVIWPLRFRLRVLKAIPRDLWAKTQTSIIDLGLNWQVGFQPLSEKHAALLMKRAREVFGTELSAGASIVAPAGVREKPEYVLTPVEEAKLSHRNLQEFVAEIGKWQSYYSELEYPIELSGEHKSLDVVWKREIAGAPTFAFEIELSSGLEKAIHRLKFAYQRWNSRPRIIIPQHDITKANNILSAHERDFSQQLRIYEPAQIAHLFDRKRDLKLLEQELGIY